MNDINSNKNRQIYEDGCPETVWDGPYSFPCGLGSETGNCPRHGRIRIQIQDSENLTANVQDAFDRRNR